MNCGIIDRYCPLMKNTNPRGLFDDQFRLDAISCQGDPLEKLNKHIDWSLFKPLLDAVFARENRGVGGRPPYDYVMMFKVLILQRYYNLSDAQTQFQILDRLSFMRFLGLQLSDRVPDEKTIWLFRQRLTECEAVEELFAVFLRSLEAAGLVGNEGQIIDASFVEAPRQRNNREDNAKIKAGETPEGWELKPNMLEQKDLDARWTKKNNLTFYGYKNHGKVDAKSKLITKYLVTDASVHDSQALEGLLEKEKDAGQTLHADSAYVGPEQEKTIMEAEMTNQVHEKGYKNKPLTDEQKASNKEKSHIRVRVEHVFGFMENSMNGMFIQSIGIVRATGIIGLMNLTYNMFRATQLLSAAKLA